MLVGKTDANMPSCFGMILKYSTDRQIYYCKTHKCVDCPMVRSRQEYWCIVDVPMGQCIPLKEEYEI